MVKIKNIRSKHGLWSSGWIFILAGVGFAVGLKNIWQFPAHAAQYGGGAYLLVYLCFAALIGIPLTMAQVLLGRAVRLSPFNSLQTLSKRTRASRHWVWLGGGSVIAGFLVLSYYNVIAGWMLAYTARAASGVLHGLSFDTAGTLFAGLVRDPEKQLFWLSLFVVMTLLVVARGLRHGLEPVIRYGVPVFFLLLLLQIIYASSLGPLKTSINQLFVMDFTKLSGTGVLTALGDAFYSLGLGVGVMMMYGAYLPVHVSIAKVSTAVVLADTGVAVLASLVVLPLVAVGGVSLSMGPELIFQSLVVAFDSLPGGGLMRFLFFVMLVLVAWLSAIALMEPVVAWLVESRDMSRVKASLLCAVVIWVLSLANILSLNAWKFVFSLFHMTKTLGLFDMLQILTTGLMLPACGILFALFSGWVLKPATSRDEFAMRSPCSHDAWLWLTRLGVPLALAVIILNIWLFL